MTIEKTQNISELNYLLAAKNADKPNRQPRISGKPPQKPARSEAQAVPLTTLSTSSHHLDSGDIDQKKVEQLRQAIALGEYHADSRQIAEGLFHAAREDLSVN